MEANYEGSCLCLVLHSEVYFRFFLFFIAVAEVHRRVRVPSVFYDIF